MNKTLSKWIIDTVAADMRSSYRKAQALPFGYEFMDRYADFYVNMLTRMFNILNGNIQIGMTRMSKNKNC